MPVPAGVNRDSAMLDKLAEWVDQTRFNSYVKTLQDWGKTVPAALQGVVDASPCDEDNGDSFVTAAEVGSAGCCTSSRL